MEVSLTILIALYILSPLLNTASYALDKYGGGHNRSFYLDDVACTGNEMKLVECMYRGVGVHNCRSGVDEGELSFCLNITIGGHSCDKSSSAGVICTKDLGVL